ncbi:MAG: hypothetical protein H6707_12725 [Deltaproteobacteria bacterium]|nr:hypothetical protein [Deltaproteobacteria bacterium]
MRWLVLLFGITGCVSTSAATDGALLADSSPDVAVSVDQFVPFSFSLTVNRLPAQLNGSLGYRDVSGNTRDYRVAVSRERFSVDLLWRGSDARSSTLSLVASAALGGRSAQSELADLLRQTADGATLDVGRQFAPTANTVTFTAAINNGAQRVTRALTVDVADLTAARDPFFVRDTWLLVFDQDNYAIARVPRANGGFSVSVSKQPNGTADFVEDLRVAGLATATPVSGCSSVENFAVSGCTAIVETWLQRLIVVEIRRMFAIELDGTHGPDSVNIAFLRQGEPNAPRLIDFRLQTLSGAERERRFSAISIGGGDPARPYLGLSRSIDRNNRQNEANIGPEFGVFTSKALATVADLVSRDAAVRALAELVFGEFVPDLGAGGVPLGESPLDPQILSAGFDPASASSAARRRYNRLVFVVELLARLVGALTAHEVGHALGLVANGPPPYGLFGGESNVGGPRTSSGHFDSPGFNIMEAGPGSAPNAELNLADYLDQPRFNPLNLAYLRGQIVLLPR